MIIAINKSWRKKAFLCVLMILMLIFMQCVIPIFEAHAVAVAVGAVAVAAIAALLVMIGVKIMPTTTTSLSTIYSNLVRSIQEGGETLYPNILNLFGTLATTGVKIGDKIKILGNNLSLIKTELLKVINISSAMTDTLGYTGTNTQLSDVTITNKDKILNYESSISSNYANNIPIEIPIKGVNSVTLKGITMIRGEYYGGSYMYPGIYFTSNLLIITFERSVAGNIRKIIFNFSGTGKNNGTSITKIVMDSGTVVFDNINNDLHIKLMKTSTVDNQGNYIVKLQIVDKGTLQEYNYTLRGALNGTDYVYPYIEGQTSYDITGTKIVQDITNTKAKVIPGTADVVIGVAGTKSDGIDVTIPNTLNPSMDSVCPDAKTQLDTLAPSIDYDDIQAHTWDDATDSELPDDVDGTIDQPDEGTGEVDVGDVNDMPDQDALELPSLITTKFPFSIPWDVKRAVECLLAPAEAPKWTIPFVIDSINFRYDIEIDLSQYEAQAAIVRWFTVLIFTLGLIMSTRKLIGQ